MQKLSGQQDSRKNFPDKGCEDCGLSRQFVDCPHSFLIVRTIYGLSGQFLYSPDSFWIVPTVFGLFGQFMDYPDNFWIIRTVSGLSGQFFGYPEKFQPVSGWIWNARSNTYLIAKTFRIFAKTFWTAMLPRWQGFSDSAGLREVEQARKLGRCDSYLQNLKTLLTDWLTQSPG